MQRYQPPGTGRRGDRVIRERVHDPYKTRLKLSEPTVCPQCGAVFSNGRWTWDAAPAGANQERCQACHRINDAYPAGVVTLRGDFLKQHAAEILNLARNQEKLENGEHPLHRIMDVSESDAAIEITTTDIHLPRRIGQAIHSAYEGDLEFHYDKGGHFIRIAWTRDA